MKFLPPRQFFIVALPLLSLALGGSTELWEQALITALVGIFILVAPPQQSLGWVANLLFFLLLALSLTAFLPASWTSFPAWRQHLVEDLHVPLPSTRTPQPWLTLQSCCLLFVGLVWTYYLFSQKWDSTQRMSAIRFLVLGIALLSVVAVTAYAKGFHVPGWNQELNRGWFPNRNQTADVLAVCGILNYALIFDRLRKKNLWGYFWMVTLLPICAALVISYSRAGIILFFIGIGIWHLWPSSHHKSSRHALKWASLSIALGFILLTFFFLFGGDTLARFQGHSDSQMSVEGDYRIAIQQDALQFSLQAPWFGIGLGNFAPLFASARHASIDQNRTIHPESDWLWAACELGWLGPLLLLAGVVWWLFRCFPIQVKPGETMRKALIVAVVVFLLHGFVDVSGHRIGSSWVALLLASMALNPPVVTIPVLRWGSLLFRGLALLLLVIAGWWFASVQGIRVPSTTAEVARLEGKIKAASLANQVESMEELTNAALRIAPLDWIFYFQRGYAEVYQRNKLTPAINDFQIARALEPNWSWLCFDEGVIWVSVNQPDLCMDAWQEAIRRNPSKEVELYGEMIGRSLDNPLVYDYLKQYAIKHTDCLLIFLGYTNTATAKSTIAEVLASDPNLQSLDARQREGFFKIWWSVGDQADFLQRLLIHKDWQTVAWPYLAMDQARQKNFQAAWEMVNQSSQPPPLPKLATNRPVTELETDFYREPSDLGMGIMLALAQIKAGQTDNAIATLRTLEKLPNRPKYIYYLEAQKWAEKQEWELAWEAWWNFYNS